MAANERPSIEHASLQYQTLGHLCLHWSRRCEPTNRWAGFLIAKLPLFREVVLYGQGGRERVERELVQDEVSIIESMLLAVQSHGQCSDSCSDVPLFATVTSGKTPTILSRPLPRFMRQSALEYLSDGRSSAKAVAKKMAAARFGSTYAQIRDGVKKQRRPGTETEPLQSLAVSVLYDLSMCRPQGYGRLSRRLVEALISSGYSPICLYYVIQHAIKMSRHSYSLPSKGDIIALATLLETPGWRTWRVKWSVQSTLRH